MHEQLQLPLDIPLQGYTPHVSIKEDPYWDELEKESSEKYSLTNTNNMVSEYSCSRDYLEHDYSLTNNSGLVSEYFFADKEEVVSEYPHLEDDYSLTTQPEGVNIYKPGGTAGKGLKYFRCSYKQGRKTKHIHIPGGNIKSAIARKNAQIIREAFESGKRSAWEIKELVRSLPKFRQKNHLDIHNQR